MHTSRVCCLTPRAGLCTGVSGTGVSVDALSLRPHTDTATYSTRRSGRGLTAPTHAAAAHDATPGIRAAPADSIATGPFLLPAEKQYHYYLSHRKRHTRFSKEPAMLALRLHGAATVCNAVVSNQSLSLRARVAD